MTIKEKLIEEIEDEDILKEIHQIILTEIKSGTLYKVSPEEKNAIAQARKELQNGSLRSHEEVKKQTSEFLKSR